MALPCETEESPVEHYQRLRIQALEGELAKTRGRVTEVEIALGEAILALHELLAYRLSCGPGQLETKMARLRFAAAQLVERHLPRKAASVGRQGGAR